MFSAWFLQSRRRYLSLNYFRQKYDNLYQDVSHRRASRWALLYFPIFLARRFIFVLYPWLFFRRQGFQVQALLFTSTFYIIYYVYVKPHVPKQR